MEPLKKPNVESAKQANKTLGKKSLRARRRTRRKEISRDQVRQSSRKKRYLTRSYITKALGVC